jgi:hypothetical protein
VTSGESVYIGVWTIDIGDIIPESPTIGEVSLIVPSPGDSVGFRIELTAVPPEGAEVWMGAILVQGDGDTSDDPYVVWTDNPGTVTPTDPLLGVELFIE